MLFFKKIFLSQNVTCYLKVTHIKITHINCLFSSIILPSTCLDSNFHIIDVLSSLMILFFLLVLSVKKNIAISYNLSVDIHMYIPAWSNFSVYANCHFYLTFCSPKIHDSNANQIYFPHQATTNVNNACVFLTILCKPLILK